MEEKDYRLERDSLGEKLVPKDALYGIQTQRSKENFPITGSADTSDDGPFIRNG